jgi:hypothetical protein
MKNLIQMVFFMLFASLVTQLAAKTEDAGHGLGGQPKGDQGS